MNARSAAALLGVAFLPLYAQSPVTLILINGKIWTENPNQREVEAVAIGGNRIVAVGTTAEIAPLKGPETRVIDLAGKRVVPGFNDAHVHFFSGGADLAGPQLRDAKSQQEFRDTLAAFAKTQPKGRWITGGNWDTRTGGPRRSPPMN